MQPAAERPRPEEDCPLPQPAEAAGISPSSDFTQTQLSELANEGKQAEYRRQYLLQVERAVAVPVVATDRRARSCFGKLCPNERAGSEIFPRQSRSPI
jgi:hypothetical protein